jgi:small subunit ribosomal protein S8
MISDPIGDMLTRVRNALMVGKASVTLPHSKIKVAIAEILLEEGFISGVEVLPAEGSIPQPVLRLKLKYVGRHRERRPVITGIKRVSRPGRRIYAKRSEIPWVKSGMGIAILSTPKGVVSGQTARKLGVGGEVLCHVW